MKAPELDVVQWIGSPEPITLAGLVGRPVLIEAFQMLCPGCVRHGIPQAKRVHARFGSAVAVLGLHTVFEHHAAMRPAALEAFLYEYRVPFPVGVDRHDGTDPIPVTMRALGLRGTPSAVVIDPDGDVAWTGFGQVEDLELGAVLGGLMNESSCADGACEIREGTTT